MVETRKPAARTATAIMDILHPAKGNGFTIEELIDELKSRGYQPPKNFRAAVRSSLARLIANGQAGTDYRDWGGPQIYFDRPAREKKQSEEEQSWADVRAKNRSEEKARKALIPALIEACREILTDTPLMTAHEIREDLVVQHGIETTVFQITGVLHYHLKAQSFRVAYEVRGNPAYRTVFQLPPITVAQREG